MRLEQRLVEVEGAKIHYETFGQSGDWIVFVHGFGLNRRSWGDQVKVFASGQRVMRLDGRGYGLSEVTSDTPFSPTEDLKACLDDCGIETASIVGLSRGGREAINFTLAYPDKVSRLVLADSGLDGYQFSAEYEEMRMRIVDHARYSPEAACDAYFACSLFDRARNNSLVAPRLSGIIRENRWPLIRREVSEIKPERLASDHLEEISVPTLVIIGEHDLPDFQNIADILSAGIPGARKVVIPGVGHMSNMEDSKTWNKEVLRFLKA